MSAPRTPTLIWGSIVALVAAVGAAGPALGASEPDVAYARFPRNHGSAGTIAVDFGAQEVRAALIGLAPNHSYLVIGRSIGCADAPKPANRMFHLSLSTDQRGGMFAKGFLTSDPHGPTWAPLKSVSIVDAADYTVWRCAAIIPGDYSMDSDVDGANVAFGDTPGLNGGDMLVVRTSGDSVRVTATFEFQGTETFNYTFKAYGRACGQSVAGMDPLFMISGQSDEMGLAFQATRRSSAAT